MDIPPYKIHNVLKIYTRRLIERKRVQKEKDHETAPNPPASEGKRQAVIDRISEQILQKTERWTSRPSNIKESSAHWSTERSSPSPTGEFTYFVVGPDQQKIRHRLRPDENGLLFQESEEFKKS
ncbi:MAG: DVU0524 family FlgM-associated protein [Thermodesulfobacteriota bacterium]